jgi:hypothetical protein
MHYNQEHMFIYHLNAEDLHKIIQSFAKKSGLYKCRHRHLHLHNTSRKNLYDEIVTVLRDFMNVNELVAGSATCAGSRI